MMTPPSVPRLRMRFEAAGVDRIAPFPTMTFAAPEASARDR
jgi:hypothetical protein